MNERDDMTFPLEEYNRRLKELRERMARRRLDAVIITDPENLMYLTDYQTTGYSFFQALVVPLEGVIDIDAERARLQKALEASQKEAKSLEGRLSNANFVERAKPEAVEKAREDHAHHAAEVERLTSALARLG